MGKNREQKRNNEKQKKGSIYSIYSKKHVRITLEKQEKSKITKFFKYK